jgi:N-formylglutamate deformylase
MIGGRECSRGAERVTDETELQWLTILRGSEPLLLTLPHTGTELVAAIEPGLVSPWLARKDADWWIDRLYDFAGGLGATIIRTALSRTVIDVNRDPSGASLYPGQATTELCPTTTFDGEPLYRAGHAPNDEEIAARRHAYFKPYHRAVAAEIARLRARHALVVLYDCHSIRSRIPRLFEGMLPNFNIGTNSGMSSSPILTAQIEAICAKGDFSRVTNGRFKGGYTARHYGRPADGVHAIQMELACRGYLHEPLEAVGPDNWPAPYDAALALPMRAVLERVLQACLGFATAAS